MIGKHAHPRRIGRFRRQRRARKKIEGSSERPRLAVFRSEKHMYAQVIDDFEGKTLVAAATVEKSFSDKKRASSLEGAKKIGLLLAERALAKNIKTVTFDRSGFAFHGRVKALAEGAREGGLQF